MKKKSLLGFLDEVAKESGFEKFSHSTDVGKVYVVEEIIKEAGKRYVRQYLEIAYENAEIASGNSKNRNNGLVVFPELIKGSEPAFFEVSRESITNTEIDI